MKKNILLIIFPIIVLICIVIYILCRTTVAFQFVDGENVKEVTYLTINNGYQPLSSNEEQQFMQIFRNIKIRTFGVVSATDITGGGQLRDQFCITLTDGTQYIIGSLYPYLNINGKGYLVVGQESEEGLRELEDIFYDQLDHMVPW